MPTATDYGHTSQSASSGQNRHLPTERNPTLTPRRRSGVGGQNPHQASSAIRPLAGWSGTSPPAWVDVRRQITGRCAYATPVVSVPTSGVTVATRVAVPAVG
jgi:hypothetical protein